MKRYCVTAINRLTGERQIISPPCSRENGYMNCYADLTDAEVFRWWLSKKGIKQWYAENKKQYKLFSDEEINGL